MSSEASDIESWKQDSECCFEDVYFLVENTLFKVPKHRFAEGSPVFGDMFRLPAGDEVVPDGSTKAKPIHLQQISAQDFRQLLRVLDPRHYKREHLTVSEWSSVLKLATMWDFEEVRSTAISELESLHTEGPTLLALAQDYNVERLWVPALRLLADSDALTEEEIGRLGISTSMRVALFQGHVARYKQRMKDQSQLAPPALSAPSAGPGPAAGPAASHPGWGPTPVPISPRSPSLSERANGEFYIDLMIRKVFPEVKLGDRAAWRRVPPANLVNLVGLPYAWNQT